jgi:hypothetical protein
MRRLLPLLALLACAEPAPRATVPTYPLAATADTLVVPVVHVSDAAQRSDSTWVVLGIEEMEVHVADFAARTVALHPGITREEVPGAVTMTAMGDTIYLGDYGLRRVTAWLGDGRRVDAVPIPAATRGAYPRGRDAAGQWYFELWPSPGLDGRGVLDSGAVVRGDVSLTRFDTVARLTPPAVMEVDVDGRRRLQQLVLAGRDAWGVRRDGTVWLGRINQNQVFWIPPGGGAVSSTDPLPDPIVQVTEMDRQIYIRRYPEEQRAALATVRFAGVKPPFERAFADSRGRVWLFKSAPALDTLRSFQVVDSTGWLFSVQVPSYGVALGVSDTHILMGEEFPEGIRLLRFPMPAEL